MKQLKNEWLRMRLTPDEKAELKRLADLNKITMTDFFKARVFNSNVNLRFAES